VERKLFHSRERQDDSRRAERGARMNAPEN